MAQSEVVSHRFHRSIWPSFGCLFLFFGYFSVASPSSHGRSRVICWQAIMNCQAEPDCHYAYGQYMHACGAVLTGEKKKCPSHCISSLVQLNLTRNGPALEDCSCAADPLCRSAKRAIEPCLPRTSTSLQGCTEARHQCERDAVCSSAMREYLVHCGKLFSGATCTNACRSVISDMRKIPKAQLLDSCVCDGTERTICEYVKSSMRALCFDSPVSVYEGSGSEDYNDEEDEDIILPEDPEYVGRMSAGPLLKAHQALTMVASILVLLTLI